MGLSLHDMPHSPTPQWCSYCGTSELSGWMVWQQICGCSTWYEDHLNTSYFFFQRSGFEIWFSSLACLFCDTLQTSVLKCRWITCCLYSDNSYIAVGTTGKETFLIFAKLCGFWEMFTSLHLCHLLMLKRVSERLHGGNPGIWKGLHSAVQDTLFSTCDRRNCAVLHAEEFLSLVL